MFPLHSLGSGDLYVDLYAVLVFNSFRLWESSTTRRPAVGSLHTVPEKWFCWNLQEDGAGSCGLSLLRSGVRTRNSQLENPEVGLMRALG